MKLKSYFISNVNIIYFTNGTDDGEKKRENVCLPTNFNMLRKSENGQANIKKETAPTCL